MTQPAGPSKQDIWSFNVPKGVIVDQLSARSPENRDDRKHRHWKEARSFWIKEASVYVVALMILVATACYCFWALFQKNLPREDRQWAMSVLGSLLIGIVGYVFGKATK